MAARGEDTLTQIQKYKAMLRSKRNKGDEKAIRKPKKKRLRKGNVETGLQETALTVPGLAEETQSKSQAETLEEENVDSTKLETDTVLSQESKQSTELPTTNDGDLVEPESTITSAGDENQKDNERELVVNDRQPTYDKKEGKKKEKSKGLSLRRKRKSKKHKEAENKAQPIENEGEIEEDLEEKYSWKESAPELVSASPLSSETKQDDSLFVEVSPGQNLVEAEENRPKEETEGKEKISRAKKFKRWASFGKQKKTSESVVIEDLESSKSSKSSGQGPDSLDDGTSERNLIKQSLPGEKLDIESSAKEETGNYHENLECPPLPEKQRKRSVSLNEPTDKENDSLSLGNAQRTRSASFGKGVILSSLTKSLSPEKPRKISQVKKTSVEQDNETASSKHEDDITELDKQNNENVNEVENEQALEQKSKRSFVEGEEQQSFDGTETGDEKKEQHNTESPVKDDQPKKKKKSFLRKISKKNLKANKKDEESREPPKKLEISAPLLVKFESLTGSDVLSSSKPIEASPEKPNKRKKSGLNLNLPKALKRVKTTEYKVIGGAEAEKEIERDEALSQNNLEKPEAADEDQRQEEGRQDSEGLEKVQESAENDEVPESANADESESKAEKNDADDGEAYSICRAVMKDVLKELLIYMNNAEENNMSQENDFVQATNETRIPEDEELKTNKEEKKVDDEIKEEKEEKYCMQLIVHEGESSSVLEGNKKMIGEERSGVTIKAEEESQQRLEKAKESTDEQEKDKEDQAELEKPRENNTDPDITEQAKEGKTEMKTEPKDQSEYQDIQTSFQETEETVQEPSALDPKQPENMATRPDGELNISENEPEPEDVSTQFEDEIKQPEEMANPTEDQPNKLEDNSQHEDLPTQPESESNKDDAQAEEVSTQPEGEPSKLEDNSQHEYLPTQPESDSNKDDAQAEEVSTQPEGEPNKRNFQPEDVPTQPEGKPKEFKDNEVSELNESLQPTEASSERSMPSEGTSNFYKNEVSVLERSVEVSMKTQALVDSYILIDHSLQLSHDFLKQVELMDLNYSNKRKQRCRIM